MKNFVIVSGMFRSGTTLVSTMLNAHPALCSSADSYQPILKAFRNQVAERVYAAAGRSWDDGKAPLGDYYFNRLENALMTQIQNTSFAIPRLGFGLKDLRDSVASYASGYSPKIIPFLGYLEGETYLRLFETAFEIVEKAYGEGKSITHPCTKLVWSDEFIPHFLRAFPRSKVINVIRDPRAVCASRNVYEEKYPWIFLARQWRKLAAFSWMIQNRWTDLTQRVLLIRYEDLVSDPSRVCGQIAGFLGISDASSLMDAEKFVGGDGQPWHQNSSYYANEKGLRQFNPESIDKWKNVLTQEEIGLIEQMCLPEMRVWGYQPLVADKNNFPARLVESAPAISNDRLSGWIKAYFQDDPENLKFQMNLEKLRFESLKNGGLITRDQKRLYFLFEDFFEHAKIIQHGGTK